MRNDHTLRVFAITAVVALSACGGSDRDPAGPAAPTGENPPPVAVGGTIAAAACLEQFALIPPIVIDAVAQLRVFYGHTSHGSQLMTGLDLVEAEAAAYQQPLVVERSGDLGHLGDLAWEQTTRAWLSDHAATTDVVIWSWCGGCSDNTPAGIDAYLIAMNQLEIDFPDVVFVYMTGHLDGSGPEGTLYANNDRIRAYCDAHEKWLFDFADIESYDPAGNYYPNDTDACQWCAVWCATHDCPGCGGCAHSHCLNCYHKGLAFWWLLARIAGWQA
jgi:hypothetical protein